MNTNTFQFIKLMEHVGHAIECVTYGNESVSIECIDCSMVLVSVDLDTDC